MYDTSLFPLPLRVFMTPGETVADTAASAEFAAIKQALIALLELDETARCAEMAKLESAQPALAAAVADLLQRLDPADLQPPIEEAMPATLGPFTVLRLLGSGGMGEVFLGQRIADGFEQRVALKRVQRLARSPDLARRFLRERQLLARLDHPGIARLIDGGVAADGRAWLAMEYVDGLGLLEHAGERQLDLRARVALFRGVCAAIAHAHRHLIVHRDLKPGNVMVTAGGQTKLLDFGIAKLLDDSDADPTRTHGRMLTMRYAAPEQLLGTSSTTATDVHALGVLLFELLTGCSPFARAQQSGDWGQSVLAEPPQALEPLRTPASGWPDRSSIGELDRILRQAMAKRPVDRYAGVAAFDDDLEDWLARRPLRSGIGGARAQTLFLLRRYRLPLGLAAATLLALSIGLAIARQQALRAERETQTAAAHLDAVLDVIGAANPGYFGGRDPSASEFLQAAAHQLASNRFARPELRRRALTEIGHGLINLGKPDVAAEVLQMALVAADEDPAAHALDSLGVLALLIESLSDDASRQTFEQVALRIESLASRAPVDSADALDALTRAGAALSRQGEFTRANRMFAKGEARLDTSAPLASRQENFWRQRGWAALRANDAALASAYLDHAGRVAANARPPLSAMRVAEGDLLQAQAALLRDDAVSARRHVESARHVYAAEFDAAHSESAVFAMHDAEVLLAETNFADAEAVAGRVQRRLAGAGPAFARDRAVSSLLRAQALAALGECSEARLQLDAGRAEIGLLLIQLPREMAKLASASATVGRHCQSR